MTRDSASRPSSDENETLGVQLSYWRAELASLEGRLERAYGRATGLGAVCLAVAGAAATVLAALHRRLSAPTIICLIVGGGAIVLAAVRAITARDTSDEEFWLWQKLGVTGQRTKDILRERKRLRPDLLTFPEGKSSTETRRLVVDSLQKRSRAAEKVCQYTDEEVGRVAIFVIVGVALLTVAVIFAIARV